MKAIITLISTLTLLTASMCYAATPEDEAKFIKQVREVFTSKNKEAYMALHCLNGATEKQIASITRDAEFFLSKEYTVMELRDKDPSRPKEFIINEVKHSSNLEVVKVLYMEFNNESNSKTKIHKNLGEKEGKLMFAVVVPKS